MRISCLFVIYPAYSSIISVAGIMTCAQGLRLIYVKSDSWQGVTKVLTRWFKVFVLRVFTTTMKLDDRCCFSLAAFLLAFTYFVVSNSSRDYVLFLPR